jgi:hypothetical protein
MSAEFDHDLTADQWETLKALRAGTSKTPDLNPSIVDSLIALQLAAINANRPMITAMGRKVLVRGSPRLWDVAA